jgi:sulfatase modifying factor 1
MRNRVLGLFRKSSQKTTLRSSVARGLFYSSIASVVIIMAGCPGDTGDLTGVLGRAPWFHQNPPGMVYVKSGTFHTGQGTQDVFNSYLQPNKQMTITGFWMDESEITNNEYRQFVFYVMDSLQRQLLKNWDLTNGTDIFVEEYAADEQSITLNTSQQKIPLWKTRTITRDDKEYDPNEVVYDDNGNPTYHYVIDHNEPIDVRTYLDDEQTPLETVLFEDSFYYTGKERFKFQKQVDTRRLMYEYEWIDYRKAAFEDRDRYDGMNRESFIVRENVLIYPDTLCWIRDFTYSYNEPMARHYFWHVVYDDYPVVGVNWAQARAFCDWRTNRKNSYFREQGLPTEEFFRLPTEYEWEYAARGGRIGNRFPWGGPYARNTKGCMLANFYPLRGDFGADGGVYPIKVKSYFPNDFGLYDMSGNVAEWTRTTWSEGNNTFVHSLNGNYEVYIKEHAYMNGKYKHGHGGTLGDKAHANADPIVLQTYQQQQDSIKS